MDSVQHYEENEGNEVNGLAKQPQAASDNPGGGLVTAPSMVTQAELQEVELMDQLAVHAQLKRKQIRERILHGAPVEPGAIRVKVEERPTVQVNQTTLREALDPGIAARIIEGLPVRQVFFMRLLHNTYRQARMPRIAVPVFDPAALQSKVRRKKKRRIGLEELAAAATKPNDSRPADQANEGSYSFLCPDFDE